MFNEIKEKRLSELQFINKVEMLISEIVQTRTNGELGWDYVENPGWSPEDSPQFHKDLSKPSFDIKALEIKYEKICTSFNVTLYTADKVFRKPNEDPCQYWYGDNKYRAYKIDGWFKDCIMLAEFDFWVDQHVYEGEFETSENDIMTQFKIIISLNKFNRIDVDITTEYNQEDRSDFFVEVCDIDYESDESYGRILSDTKLPREKLVKWFSSVLHGIDKIFNTKYERPEGEMYPYNGTHFSTIDRY